MRRMFSAHSGIFTFSNKFTRWLVVRNSSASNRCCSSSRRRSIRSRNNVSNVDSPSSSHAGVAHRSGAVRLNRISFNARTATPAMFPGSTSIASTVSQDR